MPGYVKIFRSLQDSFIWQDKPFNYASAWIDLIMLANHNGNKFLLGTQLIEVNRGEFITSQDKLAKRWGWGNTKLRSFLKLLENEKMIVQKPTRKQTAIEIVNYSVYQHSQIENKPIPNRYQTDTKPIPNTNNNVKNDKNDKNVNIKEEIYKEERFGIVTLTTEEYEKLCQLFTKQKVDDKIEDMNEYCVNNKKHYQSYYLALNKWLKKDVPQVPQVSKSVEQIRDYLKRQKEKE